MIECGPKFMALVRAPILWNLVLRPILRIEPPGTLHSPLKICQLESAQILYDEIAASNDKWSLVLNKMLDLAGYEGIASFPAKGSLSETCHPLAAKGENSSSDESRCLVQ